MPTTTVNLVGSTAERRRLVISVFLVACAPLVLLLFNTDWLLTNEGWLDAWHYVGFFNLYTDPNYSAGAYKLARLPWILAGYAVNRMLPPLAAAYVLHLTFLSLTCVALFVGTYALLRRPTLAAVTAIWLGFYTHEHGSGGWDYHNTAAGAFYLLTVMILGLPGSSSGPRVRLMLGVAGVTAALALHANITLVNFLPVLALVYVRTRQLRTGERFERRTVIQGVASCVAGAVLVTIALGLVNWMVGREALFFQVLLNIVGKYVADPNYLTQWRSEWGSGWVFRARHLALPAAVFVVGAWQVLRTPRAPDDPTAAIARVMIAQFLLMVPVWIAWQLAGQLALDWDYFAYVLVPSCFIAIAGMLYPAWPAVLERQWLVTIGGTILVSALPLSGVLEPYASYVDVFTAQWIGVAGGLAFAIGFSIAVWRQHVLRTSALLVLFALTNRCVVKDPIQYMYADPCKVQPAVYTAVLEGGLWLGGLDGTYSRIRTWFREGESIQPAQKCIVRLDQMSAAITQTPYFGYVTRPWPMPPVANVPGDEILQLAAREGLLAIITNESEHLDSWARRLRELELEHRFIGRREVRVLDAKYTINVWRLATAPRDAVVFDSPVLRITEGTPLAVNAYGSPKAELLTRNGQRLFDPTHHDDHLAHEFVDLPARDGESWARLTITSPRLDQGGCQVFVQLQDFRVLGSVHCSAADENTRTTYLRVPAEAKAIRVYVQDRTELPFVLPSVIEVSLSRADGTHPP